MGNAVNRFVLQLLERAGKTAAQAALLELTAENLKAGVSTTALNALQFHWAPLAGFALGGFVVSMLTSIGSVPVGQAGSPSLVKEAAVDVPVPVLPAPAVAAPTDSAAVLAEAQAIHPL
jgi:hypothetical protein